MRLRRRPKFPYLAKPGLLFYRCRCMHCGVVFRRWKRDKAEADLMAHLTQSQAR